MREPGHGEIITFYSHKGGTGRTMSLANVAWILASNGKRVLAAGQGELDLGLAVGAPGGPLPIMSSRMA
jgi:MinD-like ATPase involved in chromosome partitioning or flagellar assembly